MEHKLFSSYVVKGVTLKNRIVMSPMCMYSSDQKDGKIRPFHISHYESRAAGQVGLIIVEATAVTPQGRISPYDLGIWSDDHISGLTETVERIHAHGAKAAIQLAHAGRKAELDGPIIAPSAIPYDKMKTPDAMTEEQISETIEAFKLGALRAKKAGFDIIEIHGAHGYLINEFLSPLTNKRTDAYGGSLENRYRLLREIISEIQTVWDGPLFVRISAAEYAEGGNELSDFITLAKWMKKQGIDLIDCSSGAVVPAPIPVYPGYQVPLAEAIRHEANIATGAVGLITSGIQAEEILQNERADLIFVARELLRNPYWPREAALELGTTISGPSQYDRAWL
ncbi:NADPH dehydrogenase NamA [Halalkalibacterium halodurans]|uniref:NADPH dehydrogenase n=1 Tax=Halalkalibacterium halodurans TaxID=86665 RepID=A0A0M0KL11_ALKHA|nr:NADPH dehydrogenase NamA [Halalkalibacterium halodurans]MDY7222001.1 NADPH dehydrogenase NamA [Halalkalibacterium halodurans]MDY7241277.1 NADPH dehydrogenase NamA [Halalkalibacterium halodurans]MED4082892.1 NADPH dehydrogenase NamA [Halalkalibacterium halodurans]MED4084778.1 NADPH dehydrogenase NamA [Halalkalibacterium halodurans]MED4106114.1 NADPH dehydrogenase NamA [Halalkalibacterium halodurans]